jgi:glutathione S-transferase
VPEGDKVKIYADPITVNCRKVLAGLQLMGINYELKHVDYFKAEQKSPEYLAVNPNSSLPAMVDGDFVLWESNAILQYAADKYGKSQFYPTDLKTRADINRWLLWESSSWFPSTYVYLVEHCVKPLLSQTADAKTIEAQDANFHKLAAILDARLAKHAFIVGNSVSIADIALAAPMHLHQFQKLPLSAHPNLKRWMLERIEPMPAWQNTFVGENFTLTKLAA